MTTDALPSTAQPAIRTIAMSADTNPAGGIFEDWLVSQMDLACGSVAIRTARGRCATVSVDSFQFHRPVAIGDKVSIYATLEQCGRTSMIIVVKAWCRMRDREDSERLIKARFVFVALDAAGQARMLEASGLQAVEKPT